MIAPGAWLPVPGEARPARAFLLRSELIVISARATEPHSPIMNSALRRLRALIIPCAWLLSLSCVAAVLATLFWRLAAPPPVDRPVSRDSDPRATAQRIAGQGPFAGQRADRDSTPVAAVAASAFSLVGLATGFVGGPGFALLKVGARAPEAFVEGDELAAGVRLERILADGVEIKRNGRVEKVPLASEPIAGIEPVDPSVPPPQPAPVEQAPEPQAEAASDGLAPKDN